MKRKEVLRIVKKSHKVLMNKSAIKEQGEFYQSLTPPAFELVCVENANNEAEVATTLKDIEFSFGIIPPGNWLDMAPNLKLIQSGGVGYTDATIQAVRNRGIPIAITPEGTCLGVAEHTILLILALYKHLVEAHQAMKDGKWIHQKLRGNSHFLYDKVLGVIGLGRIGIEVIQRAKGFLPKQIVYFDLFRKTAEQEKELGVEYLELDRLLQVSDIVTSCFSLRQI